MTLQAVIDCPLETHPAVQTVTTHGLRNCLPFLVYSFSSEASLNS